MPVSDSAVPPIGIALPLTHTVVPPAGKHMPVNNIFIALTGTAPGSAGIAVQFFESVHSTYQNSFSPNSLPGSFDLLVFLFR
ncbi:hypothetical protein SAMN05421788_102568 [Filimonas lacunae]|uniref:Uncharacterized protein n=1 Tax=Filimonas lacunae TaxID=477680 RepID=A0A1N7NMX5_9BACT|nr:hypothetical protein SAMN05421788_102568 [Filimonas lacunae]